MGTGSFGVTYLAHDLQLDRQVALKEYLPVDWASRRSNGFVEPRTESCSADYEWGLKRFLDEAAILARLDHPQIVRVHRIIRARGTAYIVMEYLGEHSLAGEIRASGRPLSEERVLEILLALADGLEEVHRAGILHRDIKPANVMLRDRDNSPVLVDFGSARQHIGDRSRSLTAVLTPGYAPIEQYGSTDRQGPWTDIYALGALAYEALTGKAPDVAPNRRYGRPAACHQHTGSRAR